MGDLVNGEDQQSQSQIDLDKLLSARYNIISSGGSLDCESLIEPILDDVTESEPTSIILNVCKKRFLSPYVNILSLVGLRPMTVDSPEWSSGLGHLQTATILVLLICGYILQYILNFRRDQGEIPYRLSATELYSYQETAVKVAIDFGKTIFVYVVPAALHLFAFFTAIYVFRMSDNEQLQNLVERVFLLSNAPIRLVLILWIYVVGCFIWLCLMTSLTVIEINAIDMKKIDFIKNSTDEMQYLSRAFLMTTMFCHDLIQMVILSTYAIHCYLLRRYLYSLKEKLIQNTIEIIDWMREICEFQKLLHNLNKKVSTPICFLTILNLTYALSGTIYLFRNYDYESYPIKIFSLNIGNILLWLMCGLFPFFQASSLTLACRSAQLSGHHIRIRPFVYHNTSTEELNSVLLFSSSLRLSAKLFRMPVYSSYLFFIILCLLIIVLTLGMCLNVSLGIL